MTAITTQFIGNQQVTYPKIQNASATTLIGNPTGSAASVGEITLGSNLSFSGSVLNAGTLISYVVDEFPLTSTDITNQYVTLSHTPTSAASAILNVIGGLAQNYGVDFSISGTKLGWTGLGLQGLLASGDNIIVQYYYNAPSSGYTVNEFTLSPTDITNKYVTLTSAPAHPTLAILNVIDGIIQLYATDFSITGTQLSWSGLGLDGNLISGDVLQVQFY